MESRCSSDLKFESNFRIHRKLPAYTAFSLIPMGLIKNPKSPYTVEKLAVTWWFRSGCQGIIRHKLNIPSVFWLVNTGVKILVGEIRIFGVQYVDEFEIGSMCHLVNTTIERHRHSGHCYHQHWFKGWDQCWMPVGWCWLDLQQAVGHGIQALERIPLPFFTDNAGKVTVRQNHPLFKSFPHKMDSGNPISTVSVTNLPSIAAATEVKVFPRPISSATDAPGISASQTHLITMNQMAQTWCFKNLVPGRPGIEYMWPGTWSSGDWWIGWTFSSLTSSSRHSCSNSLLIGLRTVFSTELVFSGSRTSSPSSTCSWTSPALLSVLFSSFMISFCCSDLCLVDKLRFRCSWNSSQC